LEARSEEAEIPRVSTARWCATQLVLGYQIEEGKEIDIVYTCMLPLEVLDYSQLSSIVSWRYLQPYLL